PAAPYQKVGVDDVVFPITRTRPSPIIPPPEMTPGIPGSIPFGGDASIVTGARSSLPGARMKMPLACETSCPSSPAIHVPAVAEPQTRLNTNGSDEIGSSSHAAPASLELRRRRTRP